MILMIDNFDSFTYNLVQYLGELGADLVIRRNNEVTVDEIRTMAPAKIVISPGPCTPDQAGISVETVQELGGTIPILGVCLGHQSIGAAYGGKVIRAPYLMHGKTSDISHDAKGVFAGVDNPFTATRYHSLVIEKESLPDCLEVTARTEDDIIMGVRHREHPVTGLQFHPESILTDVGKKILGNFLKQ